MAPKRKFTTSDALALGTTAVSAVGSFSEGLKYNPNADKPKLFTPFVRPSVGDPNLDRHLRDIDQKNASARRAIRDTTGSDTNAGTRGILAANEQAEGVKSKVYGQHATLIEQQEQQAAATINQGKQFNVSNENRFRERRQDRDVEDTRRVREAAKESLESGIEYASDRDAFYRDAAVKEKQGNARIDMVRQKQKDNFIASMTPHMTYQGAVEAWDAQVDQLNADVYDKMYSFNYHDNPNKTVEKPPVKATTSSTATPVVGASTKSPKAIYTKTPGESITEGLRKFFTLGPNFKSGIPQ